ncbi:MAG: hypothetical protein ACK5RO_00840 [Pseudobdellovibrionaceae bacterium]|jgi:hypothetical protein
MNKLITMILTLGFASMASANCGQTILNWASERYNRVTSTYEITLDEALASLEKSPYVSSDEKAELAAELQQPNTLSYNLITDEDGGTVFTLLAVNASTCEVKASTVTYAE